MGKRKERGLVREARPGENGQRTPPHPQPVLYGPSSQPWLISLPINIDLDLNYYLSGPMYGYEDHNWPAFNEAARILREAYLTITNPTEINPSAAKEALENPNKYHMQFLKEDLLAELNCDGLILLNGWPKSKGARRELDVALDLEYPIYYYHKRIVVSFQ
jgi:hypothetical protein